jgi:hypothetical protein
MKAAEINREDIKHGQGKDDENGCRTQVEPRGSIEGTERGSGQDDG